MFRPETDVAVFIATLVVVAKRIASSFNPHHCFVGHKHRLPQRPFQALHARRALRRPHAPADSRSRLGVFAALPWVTPWFNRRFGNRPSEMEIKFLLFCLLGLGALAGWADSEAVLPAYIIGMMLAGTVGKDHVLVRRMRAMTFGLMTPFYFIRAGAFVSIPALVAAPFAFFFMLAAKMVTKFIGVYPVTRAFKTPNPEAMYTTLLMSTGLTFAAIDRDSGYRNRRPWLCHWKARPWCPIRSRRP